MRYRESNSSWPRSSWEADRSGYRSEGIGQGDRYESAERGGHPWSLDEGRTELGRQHWGRGPKGYQRADTRIHEDVCDRLTYSDVDAEHLEVRVENGEVTLSGTVRDRWDKRRAEDVAEEVSGVRDVHNNIRVQRDERGIGQSESSASSQPGTVLGVNPTAEAQIKTPAPKGTTRT